VSGDWLAAEVRRMGLSPTREVFRISRIDPLAGSLSVGQRRIQGIPLFDGSFTDSVGIQGRLGPLGSDAAIGLTEIPPNAADRGPIGEARRTNCHQAIVIVTRGGRPGLCPNNADNFLHPFGPPVLQVSSDESAFLADRARSGSEVTIVAAVRRTQAEAFNVLTTIQGKNPALPPLVIMTPRSGWWTCAGERGGGIACWLEIMRRMRDTKPARDVHFIASSGHELAYRGIEVYAQRAPDLIRRSRAWIHLGANIGAAQEPGNMIQASDDEMESVLAKGMTASGLAVDVRVPRGTVPGGEAGVVHRGGGRYMSVIGRNALFHNPADRGPDAVDPDVIARFAEVFSAIAISLAEE